MTWKKLCIIGKWGRFGDKARWTEHFSTILMGNSNPHNLKDEREASLVRKRFNERLEHELNAHLIPIEEEKGAALFIKENYYIAVSHGSSSIVGTEFTLRFSAPTKERAIEILPTIGMIFNMFITMQDKSKFRPNETAEILTPLAWSVPSHGTQGCAILLDKTLKGLNSNGDDSFNEDGPLHDADYWPQHFLLIFPLRPAEYLFTNAVNSSICLPIIQSVNPNFLTDFDREDYISHPVIGPQLHELQLSTAAKTIIDGLTLDLRIRQNGTCVDMVMGPRWMAPILEALQQAYNKPTVPQGTLVIAQSDGLASHATFYCHDIYNNHEVITPESAYFRVKPMEYMNGKTNEIVQLPPDLMRKYCLCPPGELWNEHSLIRMVHVEFFLPSLLLSEMITRVREVVIPQMDDGTWDPELHPVILEWRDQFVGLNGKSGFVSSDVPQQPPTPVTTPARFRFVCAGMSYSQDESYIDDDGIFHPKEAEGSEEEGESGMREEERNEL
jgi:hypothetical protein